MRKILFGVGFVIVVGGLVFASLRSASRRGVEVDVEAVQRRDLVARVSGSGRIEARRSVDVVANVVGKVIEVAAHEGETVKKGQLILRIDPAERQSAVDQAAAGLAASGANAQLAKAELRQSEQALDRTRSLVQGGLASAQDLENAETDRDARARVEQARTELDRTVVRADIAGVVVRLAVEEGENVLAGDLYNAGSAIVTIADLSAMEAQILVDETEVVQCRAGQEATVEVDAFPERKLTGKVFEVGNSAYDAGPLGSQEAKDFRVRILLEDPPATLRPGLSARAEVVTDTRDSVLSVPIEALVLRDPEDQAKKLARKGRTARGAGKPAETGKSEDREKEGVFLLKDGVAAFAPLVTGIAGEQYFEVVSGLDEGVQVIRGPFDALRRLDSGERIRVRNAKSRAKAEAAEGPGASGGDAEAAP